jgi:sulfur carrier protein ThiS
MLSISVEVVVCLSLSYLFFFFKKKNLNIIVCHNTTKSTLLACRHAYTHIYLGSYKLTLHLNECSLNLKSIELQVRLLRTMLQWEEQLRSEASLGQLKHDGKSHFSPASVVLGEVVIVCWPRGEIIRLSTGSTAADAARKVGLEGKMVLVNGHPVLPCTELKDGDVVEVRI